MVFMDRLRHAWDAFRNRDPTQRQYMGPSYYDRPDRVRYSRGAERTIVTSIYNRITMDSAAISIQHIQTDGDGRFLSVKNSGLNKCLSVEANIDQTGRAFIQDAVASMLDEGVVAIVPVETSIDPKISESYNINSLRTAKILEWYPKHVRVRVYNEKSGKKEDITLPKSMVAIVENPLYAVFNEPSSTMQRLIRKLNMLDAVDEQVSSGKLDMIIQLPYAVKSKLRKNQAEERRQSIADQLKNSKYGVAYIDATEKVTQLNRPLENNLLKQVEYLTEMVYSQIGITKEILNGSADDKTMLNYYNRVIEPILSAIVDEMRRKFLTKTARSQGQTIKFFRDPFKLVPVNDLAEIVDKFTRNEIATSNEFRQIIGWKPSDDPNADMLRNKNLNASDAEVENHAPTSGVTEQMEINQNG